MSQTAPSPNRRWGIWLLAAVVFVLYATYALFRHRLFLTAGYDLGIFDQALRAYSQFAPPEVALKGENYNILGDHFHPILLVLVPLYWIWDDPRVLIISQAALIAASVPVVWRFAARRMPTAWALGLAAGYAFSWPIAGLIDYDFHEVAFAVPVLALLVDALDRRSDRALWGWLLVLLLIREDMGAIVAAAGFLRLWRPGRLPGLLLMGLGSTVFLLVTGVVIPAFANDGQFAYWTFDALGPDLPSAFWHLLSQPGEALRLFLTPVVKAQTLAYLLVPLCLLPLASPYSLLVLPLLAERFFNSREMLWSTHYHYNAPIWVLLVLAAVDGGARLGVWGRPRLRAGVVAWLVGSQVVIVALNGAPPPVFRRMLNGNAWRDNPHIVAQRAAVAQVPPGRCVVADDRLVAHLTRTNRVTVPGIPGPQPDYVIIDKTEPRPSIVSPPTPEVLAAARAAGFQSVWERDGIVVMRAPEVASRDKCGP